MHTRIPDKGVIENEAKLRAKQTAITYSIGDRRFYKEDGGSFFLERRGSIFVSADLPNKTLVAH